MIINLMLTANVLLLITIGLLAVIIGKLYDIIIIIRGDVNIKKAVKTTISKSDDPYHDAWEGDPINPDKRINTVRG